MVCNNIAYLSYSSALQIIYICVVCSTPGIMLSTLLHLSVAPTGAFAFVDLCRFLTECLCLTTVGIIAYSWSLSGNNLIGVAEQFTTQDQENATQISKSIHVAVFCCEKCCITHVSYQILQNCTFLLCKFIKVNCSLVMVVQMYLVLILCEFSFWM